MFCWQLVKVETVLKRANWTSLNSLKISCTCSQVFTLRKWWRHIKVLSFKIKTQAAFKKIRNILILMSQANYIYFKQNITHHYQLKAKWATQFYIDWTGVTVTCTPGVWRALNFHGRSVSITRCYPLLFLLRSAGKNSVIRYVARYMIATLFAQTDSAYIFKITAYFTPSEHIIIIF